MDRNNMLMRLKEVEEWDIIVIGGGASGLGTALDAASRGFKTLLLEQNDFAKGTSSRSTKLVHGGVRYLQQGDISLVLEALRERGLMLQNAPHLVRNQSFIIPNYEWWGGPFYAIGLKMYDMMAGKLGLGPSKSLTPEETIKSIPTLVNNGLKGGVVYQDGQFDDARMAISLALTCADYGGTVLNYMEVTGLLKNDEDIIEGVEVRDLENNENYRLKAKAVINATGVWADRVMQMDKPDTKDMIRPSQGVHLVLDKSFLQSKDAIMIPHTSDGRVLFAVPWYNRVIVGTTDTLVKDASLEPRALEEEIEFILNTAGIYLTKVPTRKDVKSIFAGLRPLAASEGDEKSTKEISRHHKVLISISGLITITGGKWTTYRKMGEDAVDKALLIAGLPERKSITENLMIHSYSQTVSLDDPNSVYGSDLNAIEAIALENKKYAGLLSDELQISKVQLIWAVREEMARNVEDFLARRTRVLFLDARESIKICETVAQMMADELDFNDNWVKNQVKEFTKLAKGYYLA
ncbi:MAG: glycerol-3-phosphate dehydrogenase/oxidase [Cyclobacteriaceae bacterium]|nr:glycerol-3-phosphate dehydrogenase/oxidase [Cyclobacteriaceae bacterium]MCK5470616.1 glycerol-3-phosphate dehydrogenase/oxidase [Cyclobacteriaceae bacterium]